MRLAIGLLVAHLAALAFGLGGMLIALPNPSLWAGSPLGVQVFGFGMQFAGSLHILFGAAAMLAFGVRWLGWSRTLIFFFAATCLSLGSELLGTGTGWPFGAYEYTEGLGLKVLGRVPFTIPLSWFYVGLSAYLLGSAIAAGRSTRRTLWGLALGAYFLTVWDLVLDPAMAHESLPLKFWTWHETGPYFGMPIKNFIGWTATGLLFMAVSRALWRTDVGPDRFPAWFPLAIYAANLAFAMVLSAGVGLWLPIGLALLLGLLPAYLASRQAGRVAPPGLAAGVAAGRSP